MSSGTEACPLNRGIPGRQGCRSQIRHLQYSPGCPQAHASLSPCLCFLLGEFPYALSPLPILSEKPEGTEGPPCVRTGRRTLCVLWGAWLATLAPCHKMAYWPYTLDLSVFLFNPGAPNHLMYLTRVCFNSDVETNSRTVQFT